MVRSQFIRLYEAQAEVDGEKILKRSDLVFDIQKVYHASLLQMSLLMIYFHLLEC